VRRIAIGLVLVGLLSMLAAACDNRLDDGDAGWEPDGNILPPDFWDPGERPPAGCGDGGCPGEGQDPGPTDFCRDSPCVFGTCREAVQGFRCECAPGYAGELCDACAPGYHPDGLGCAPDDP
jgi:hypothetical protein